MLKEGKKAGRQGKLAKQMREEMRFPGGEKARTKLSRLKSLSVFSERVGWARKMHG